MYKYYVENGFAVYEDLTEGRRLSIPERQSLGMYEVGNPPCIEDESVYAAALTNPVDGLQLREIAAAKQAKTAAVIVSDATRQVPTNKVSALVVKELVAGGVPLEGICFFVALGVHRNATEEEMRTFLGEELFGKVKIENHDPYSPDKLIDLGYTVRKTPVKVNKKAYSCDLKITIGKVELHEMAGYSGGRKNILPGVSSEETILVNHRPAMIFDPGTGAGKKKGNPIHEDMLEVAKMFGVDFSINFVVDNSGAPAKVFTGSLEGSHDAATDYLDGFVRVRLPEKPDVFVVTPGVPLSIDMYQGVKALFAIQHVVDKDTVVLLYGDFPEGMNSEDYVLPLHMFQDLDEARQWTWDHYRIQMDHTLPTIDMLKAGVKIVVSTPNVSDDEIRAIRMTPCQDLDEALKLAEALTGKEQPKVMFCPHPQRAVISY